MKSVCLVLLFFWVCQSRGDPCLTAISYPDADKRVPDNPFQADVPISDQYLPKRWYGSQGMDLAKSSPALRMCGTEFPVWVKESTATVARVCMMGSGGKDCKVSWNITAKSCGSFNVYELKRTQQENSAYCVQFNNPEERPPVYTHKPTVQADIVNKGGTSELVFHCKLTKTTAQFYSVRWYINDQPIGNNRPVIFSNVQAQTVLTETKLKENGITKPDFRVACGVQAYKSENGAGSEEQKSEKQFIGIKILDEEVNVVEGECKEVRIQLTAPFGCGSDAEDCKLTTELFDLSTSRKPCRGAAVTRTVCGASTIRRSKWNTPATLQVCGQIGVKYGSHQATQTLRLKTTQLFLEHEFWQDYDIGTIMVKVTRENAIIKGKRCSAVNDPHMTTFSGRLYEHHIDGVFTLYSHTELPLEVQLETAKCSRRSRVRCNCGLAIRAGQTVFIFDHCARPSWGIGYKQIQKGTSLLDVRQKMNRYRITLPTGGLVEVQLSGIWLNVFLSPSVKDKDKTGGLCGKLTTDCTQEMRLRNGRVSTDPYANTCNKGRRYYNVFSKNWRVAANNNLFEDNGNLTPWPNSELYCVCPAKTDDANFANRVECSALKASDECIKMPGYRATKVTRQPSRKRRNVEDSHIYGYLRIKRASDESDGNWTNGWTAEKAQFKCEEMFNSSRAMAICSGVPNVDQQPSLDNCVLDIELMGTEEFMMSSLDDVRSKCVHEVMMDPEMENSTEPGEPSMMEKMMDAVICPNECNNKGRCTNGECVCETNYGGADCSVVLTVPPTVTQLKQRDGCKLGQCKFTSVYGGTFINTTQLKCRVKQLKVFEDRTIQEGPIQEVIAEIESISEVTCHLPDIVLGKVAEKTHVKGFRVAVANTGALFSRDLDMLVLDPKCQKAVNETKWETVGSDHCIFNGQCVATGEKGPDGKVCKQRGVSSGVEKQKVSTNWMAMMYLAYSYLCYATELVL